MLTASKRLTLLGRSYAPESKAIFAAFTTPPTATRKGQIDRLVKALKAAGVWTQLDLLYILAAADSQAAYINWKNPGTFTLNPVNAPAFQADRGSTGDGATNYLDTGWDPATNAVALTQNNAHIGAFVLTAGAGSTGYDFGSATSTLAGVRVRSAGSGSVRVTSGTTVGGSGAISYPFHMCGIRRNDSANILLHRNGAANNSGAATSASLTTVDWNIHRHSSAFSDRQVAAVHCGGSLDDTQSAALYAALLAYMQGVGAA